MPATRHIALPLAILVALSIAGLGTAACAKRFPAPNAATGSPATAATHAVASPVGSGIGTRVAPTGAGAAPVAYSVADDPPLPPSGELDGIPVDFTRRGHPYRGAVDAPLTVEEFSDYHCPFCARFALQVQPTLVEEYAASGKVRFVFREYPIISLHPNAAKVSAAALCAGEQGAEAYWKLHDALFAQQGA